MNKKSFLKIFIPLVFLFGATNAYSEEIKSKKQPEKNNSEIEKNYSGLGFAAGAISGAGFSYRQFFNDKYGIKTTAVVYIDEFRNFYDVGAQGMYVLSENNWLRFYALGGIANFGNSTTRTISVLKDSAKGENGEKPVEIPDESDFIDEVTKTNDNFFNIGAGIGLEIGRKEHGLSFALELPLVLGIKDFKKVEFIYPIPQVSLIYNF